MKILTLSIIQNPNGNILLGNKKRGFGAGRYNGFGGKLEENETVEAAALREVQEEIKVTMTRYEKRGVILFSFEDGTPPREVHIFWCDGFEGTPEETEEMTVEEFPKDAIPYEKMWPADTKWLPLLLEGKKFRGTFLYNHPSTESAVSTIISYELTPCETLE